MSTPVPDAAITAVTRALMTYEPEATRTIIDSPGALLSVMLETSRRAVAAAEPVIEAAVRERIRAHVTERIRELQAMGWAGQGETVAQSELRKIADLLGDPS